MDPASQRKESVFCSLADIIVNWISLGFGLLVEQNKTFGDVNFGYWGIFRCFLTFTDQKINRLAKKKNLQIDQ